MFMENIQKLGDLVHTLYIVYGGLQNTEKWDIYAENQQSRFKALSACYIRPDLVIGHNKFVSKQ